MYAKPISYAEKDPHLVLHLAVDFKRLQEQGKDYRWPRPQSCLGVWAGAAVGAWLRWAKFRRLSGAAVDEAVSVSGLQDGVHATTGHALPGIPGAVASDPGGAGGKLKHNRWIGTASRQRQQYWWRGLRRQATAGGPASRSRHGQ